jgi:hypothetical protein
MIEYIVGGVILFLYGVCIYGLIDIFRQISKMK